MECTAIILAGGKSSRMGTNKALLPIFDKTTIEHIVDCCKQVADEVIVVTNNHEQYAFLNVPLVADTYKESGPLAGLEAGLQAAKHDKCFLVACDMPFINIEVMKLLVQHLDDYDAVLPSVDNQYHPLFAAYRKTCLAPIRKNLQEKMLRMVGIFDEVHTRILTEDELLSVNDHIQNVFFNMNRPEEFKIAQKLESELKKG
ncbi:molybdenum cofactor guanylyltransferase [Bacillus massiliigorillae]|uniref:molybdenum cofactor guanylyltransferase n=1 Tax=Bacillus massiliigorillae TaxID=1243664 RepID=UPI00039E3893|nr:molybdenum cofactor guanylyltransferase [Bacillus massiliigorillae]